MQLKCSFSSGQRSLGLKHRMLRAVAVQEPHSVLPGQVLQNGFVFAVAQLWACRGVGRSGVQQPLHGDVSVALLEV